MDWSAFLGAFLGTLINLIEIGILLRIVRNIKQMMKQFKAEGEDEKWLK